ncbi:MAG: site-specific DNA-methyltransferase [Candidatus Cloacimonetes bacterium]|nr:site-specific DNA-methyltransferase [Candidatus Cloacimonadota bacterium]
MDNNQKIQMLLSDNKSDYFSKIWSISEPFISKQFKREQLSKLHSKASHLSDLTDVKEIIKKWTDIYIDFVKTEYQAEYQDIKAPLVDFIENKESNIKIVWGNCLDIMKGMKSESVHLMVTSPPYYNAREYSQWKDLTAYLEDMRLIIREAYRVIDNHRVFVFNVGDIFDNDNISTKSTWGKRRIPLGAYFTKIFEEEGWTFVDDFIWDKGEVQSERHKNGNKPYPFYQYPMNCYEHILIFHKHRDDLTKYPCPVCGCLKVNGNAMSEIGLRSWECKNDECFERSKANRGKRFSLKTIMTQGSQEVENEIDKSFITKWRRDIIKINPVIKINSKGENTLGHTAPFPADIPEFAIKMFSYPDEYILDPFGGSFTSIIEAKKLGRIGIGIELNKTMFREAGLKNIQKAFNNNVFFYNTVISEFDGVEEKNE